MRPRAIVDDRNSLQKHLLRARFVLATAEGLGTAAIMRTAGVSKTAVERCLTLTPPGSTCRGERLVAPPRARPGRGLLLPVNGKRCKRP